MTREDIENLVARILEEATLAEKVAMMSGHGFFEVYQASGKRWGGHPYRAGGGCERLGVPALYFTDGPRGVARGNSTCFPCSMARGASFDIDLERRIGEIMGIEARAQGCNFSGAVCVNLLRHPAWGRAQETYGEDSYHVGEMGAALAQGIQTHNVIATVKHFAFNSIENARFKVDVRCDGRTAREVYLPHFKRVIDAGCASVMTSYNKWNGEYCGQHRVLLTDILRGEWGFDGFTHSDWIWGVRSPYGASAGLDIENPEPLVWGEKLQEAVESGAIASSVIDIACARILRTLYAFAAAEDPLDGYTHELVASPAHIAVAREAALKSAVLLKNDGVLPWNKTQHRKLAVLGRIASMAITGDMGSSRVQPPYVVTPLAGLQRALGEENVQNADETDLERAAQIAREADAVLVVVGYTADDEGEYIIEDIDFGQADKSADPDRAKKTRGGDRASLALPRDQIALINSASSAGKPLCVAIVAGSAVMVEEWHRGAGAILQTFYSGMEGGTALAALLFGEASPSGKLPFSVARDETDYPHFDRDADSIEYGLLHGYTLLESENKQPRYAFGHGLSYTSFRYRSLRVRRSGDVLHVDVAVANVGDMVGEEIVQVYVSPPGRLIERPHKQLKAFERRRIEPGARAYVRLTVPLASLTWWSESNARWEFEPGRYRVLVGGNSRDEMLLSADINL